MTHAGHAWAPIGTPGRCLEGVTPGSAGIFSVLSYFVAETPIMFIERNEEKPGSTFFLADSKYEIVNVFRVNNTSLIIQI